MIRFLKYIACFSVLVVATLVIGEIIVRHLPNSYSTKNRYIEEHGDSIQTVILGSSHTYFGVLADSLGPGTVNLANVSQNYEYDFRLLRHYLPEMPHLRRVILPISYFSFFDPPYEAGPGKENETFYNLYMGIDKYSRFSPGAFELYNLSIYKGKIKAYITGQRRGLCSPQGFGIDYKLSERDKNWKLTAEEHAGAHTASDFGNESYNAAWLDSLLSLCSARNLEVDLITTPVWEEYRKALSPRQTEKTRCLIRTYSTRYRLRYYDFAADPRFGEDDFYDADHLADTGALKFTKILRDSIQI